MEKSGEMVLRFPAPELVKVDPKKTLLQIVDMQYDFCDPKGRAYGGPNVERYKPNIKKLLDKARELDMVVVFQESHHFPNPFEKRWKNWGGAFGPIIDELKPIPGRKNEYIVPKTTHDIFFHTNMDDLLDRKLPDIDAAIVTGIVTNVCVLRAVLGYCIRFYRTIIPMDATITKSDELQAMTLHVMANCGSNPAIITRSDMITFES